MKAKSGLTGCRNTPISIIKNDLIISGWSCVDDSILMWPNDQLAERDTPDRQLAGV